MIIDNVKLNHLRIFETVYRTKSMTAAAIDLKLTQSGVSQHIKALEDVLGIRLFDRIKQRVVPTATAEALYERCAQSLLDLEQALLKIQGEDKQIAGRVSIGMPVEFGNNVVIPLVSQFSKKYPHVKFNFRLGFAASMNEMILNGEIDFAFVDDFALDRKIHIEPVYDEVLELCMAPEFVKKFGPSKSSRSYFEALDYVDYHRDEAILRRWFDHHLGNKGLRLNVKANIIDVQGIARLILSGVGAGVLPGHLVVKLQKEGQKLHVFKGSGKPLKNSISLAYLRERSQTAAAQEALQWFRSSFR